MTRLTEAPHCDKVDNSMLQRRLDGEDNKTRSWGFIVSVEIEDGMTTPEQVAARIHDGLSFMEGTGAVLVDALGEIEEYEEEK